MAILFIHKSQMKEWADPALVKSINGELRRRRKI